MKVNLINLNRDQRFRLYNYVDEHARELLLSLNIRGPVRYDFSVAECLDQKHLRFQATKVYAINPKDQFILELHGTEQVASKIDFLLNTALFSDAPYCNVESRTTIYIYASDFYDRTNDYTQRRCAFDSNEP